LTLLLSLESVVETVTAFVVREIGRPTVAIEADTKLLQNGLIDSFHIVQLAEEVSETFGIDSSSLVPDDFQTPRVLWTQLKKKGGGGVVDGVEGVDGVNDNAEPRLANDPPPLVSSSSLSSGSEYSYWQEVVMAWERKRPPSLTWLHNLRLRMRGTLQVGALERAIRRVLERQESLRQLFDADPTVPPPGLCGVEDVLVTSIDMRDRSRQELDELCRLEAHRPMVVGGTPLIRFFIITQADDDHTLLVVYHQLVHDATKRDMIGAEIVEAYAAIVEQRAERFSALPVRYVDHAAWEKAWFSRGGGQVSVAEARRKLAGAEPVRLPTDKPRTGIAGTEVVAAPFALGADDSRRFSSMCEAEGTLFAGFSTAVAIFLHRLAGGQDNIVFLVPTNTRWRREVQSLLALRQLGHRSPVACRRPDGSRDTPLQPRISWRWRWCGFPAGSARRRYVGPLRSSARSCRAEHA
jgi:hypothetical protein